MNQYELEIMKAILISIFKVRESFPKEIKDSCKFYLYLPKREEERDVWNILSYKDDFSKIVLAINSL